MNGMLLAFNLSFLRKVPSFSSHFKQTERVTLPKIQVYLGIVKRVCKLRSDYTY